MGWEIKKKLSNPKMLLFYASLIDNVLEIKKIANKGLAQAGLYNGAHLFMNANLKLHSQSFS